MGPIYSSDKYETRKGERVKMQDRKMKDVLPLIFNEYALTSQ